MSMASAVRNVRRDYTQIARSSYGPVMAVRRAVLLRRVQAGLIGADAAARRARSRPRRRAMRTHRVRGGARAATRPRERATTVLVVVVALAALSAVAIAERAAAAPVLEAQLIQSCPNCKDPSGAVNFTRSEEHTSELQSQ